MSDLHSRRAVPAGDRPGEGLNGCGLYLGVELVRDPSSRTPGTKAAAGIVNGMRKPNVGTGSARLQGNILEIRPPLRSHVQTPANQPPEQLDNEKLTIMTRR